MILPGENRVQLMNEKYPKYLQFSNSIKRINKRYKLTENKQVMVLEAVLSSYAENVHLSVLDLILMNEIASQAIRILGRTRGVARGI